jgi:hypothetical protein
MEPKGFPESGDSCYDFPAKENEMALMMPQVVVAASAQVIEERTCEVRVRDEAVATATPEPLPLSLRDREAYFNAVLNPPAPNALMQEAARRYFSLIKS